MTHTTTPAPVDMVRRHFPSFVRQYVVPAGDSGDYHLAAPGHAPIEVRYVRLYEGNASVTCIVPDVGTHDGGPVWCWSGESERWHVNAGHAMEQVRDMLRLARERQEEYDMIEGDMVLARTGDA